MVMKAMRSQMKLILWIVVIAFVVGFGYVLMGTGGGPGRGRNKLARGIVGEVNGQEIGYSQYREMMARNLETYRQRTGGGMPDDAVSRQIEQETWQGLVSELILQQQYRKLGIAVYDDEVVSIIRHNPPQELSNRPELMTNGQLDINKYQQVLANPQNLGWLREYELEIRKQLPLQKLRLQILSGVRVTDQEVKQAFIDRSERVRVSFIAVDPAQHYNPQAEVPRPEIENYYQEHRKEFQAPERARISYVLFPKEATPADLKALEQRIQDIHQEATAPGAAFDTMAMNYSEDPGSAAKGGDLGWFGKGQMVPEFDKVAFGLRPGQTSKPFQTQFGWHIIKLDSAKTEQGKPMIKARHILLQNKPSEETLSDLRTKAESFLDQARDESFEAAAKAQGLNAMPTTFFTRSYYIPGLGMVPELINFAFDEKLGALSSVIDNQQFFAVATIIEQKKEGIQPLADVERGISMTILRDRAKAEAVKRAAEIRGWAETAGNMEVAARQAKLPVDTASFNRLDFVPKVGQKNEFFAQAFALPEGAISQPVATEQGVYLLRVDKHYPANLALLGQEGPKIGQELLQQKQNDVVRQWFETVQRQAKVRDYRVEGM